ncbi:Enoyl reductase LovC [Cytospora mali]|uniref:Enoyl reductase LovC n=1 Tax=Cytospora mali TaxID=578113 RepID=A0A194W5R0_CYTMA|nr:Enoyl reductase LovC [Valsa mali]
MALINLEPPAHCEVVIPGTHLRQALITTAAGKLELASHVAIPRPGPNMMLCRVAAVGLNPGDAKSSEHTASVGSIGGFDFAGVVLQVGTDVKRFKPGDRVAGAAYGYNPDERDLGAFADVILATEELTLKIPSNWTFEQGATLGVVVTTAGFAISHFLQIPLPDEKPRGHGNEDKFVLVSGSGTATGVVAIQMLRLAGFKPVTTCSPASMAMVRALGAVATFDYLSPTCAADIRRFTEGRLARVLDCVTSAESMAMCYAAIGSSGGRYIALDPVSTHGKYLRRDVSADWLMAISMFGLPVRLAGVYGRPAKPELRALALRIFCTTEALIAQGKMKEPSFQIRPGGLVAVGQGIEELRRGLVKGGKLVYPLA